MLSERELLALFASSEIDTLDFKRDIPDLTDKAKLPEFIKDVIAIANSVFAKEAKRGYLIFGVENKTREPKDISGQIANHKNKTISTDSHTQIEINELNQKEFIRIIKEYVRGFYGDLIVNYFCIQNPKSSEKLAGILEINAINGPFAANKEINRYDPKTGKPIGLEFKEGQSWIRKGENKREFFPDELFKLANSKITLQAKLGSGSQVVNFNNYPVAREDAIKKYYQGHPLAWGIILANGDVKRSATTTLERKLNETTIGSRIICITGEAGAGKSTLAWRIAYNYSAKANIPLIQVLDSDSPETWYLIDIAASSYGEEIIVLVDDVFRSESAVRALSTIGEGSRMTIIATSRQNEIPSNLRIQIPMNDFKLVGPSSNEVEMALSRLNLPPEKLEADFLKKVKKAPSWLVMMYELTKGDDLRKIVRSSVEQLQKQDNTVYRAFEYVCFCGQFELPIPETLLQGLGERGSFYQIQERPSSQGFIFPTFKEGFLRTTHPLISEEALKVYRRDPIIVLDELLAAMNPEELLHRNFIFKLLDQLSSKIPTQRIAPLLNKWNSKFDDIFRYASISELSISPLRFYRSINDEEKVSQIESLIATKLPVTAPDWVLVTDSAIRANSKEGGRKRIEQIANWLTHNDDSYVRSLYLRMVDIYGTQGQIKKAILNSLEWYKINPSAINVHARLFALIAKRGKGDQINDLINEAISVFGSEPSEFKLSVNLLSLVNKRGSTSQIRKLICLSLNWLEYHPDNTEVRKTIIGIVKEKDGISPENKIIDNTFIWLKDNPDNTGLRPALLSLTTYKGTSEQVKTVKQEAHAFLQKYTDNVDVRIGYYELVEIRGSMDEKRALLQEGIEWIKQHPLSTKMRVKIMQLAKRLGTKEQLHFLVEFNRDWETRIKDPTFSVLYESIVRGSRRFRKRS